MIQMVLERSSVGDVNAYLDRVKQRIFAGVRGGMQQSMDELAYGVADKLFGNPIHSHTGELAGAILGSPKVTETPEVIRGTISSDVGKKHIGLWLEEGTHVRAVQGKLFGFTAADGNTFFTRGHKAFDVKPRPFMNPTLHALSAQIFENIQRQAIEGMAEA